MKTNKITLSAWNGLSLRIIALFATAMLVSYSPNLLRDFFCDELIKPDSGHSFAIFTMDEKWNWGYRHYLYFYMCVALFFVQVARLIKWIDKNGERFKS